MSDRNPMLLPQLLRQLLAPIPTRRIDDSTLPPMLLVDKLADLFEDFLAELGSDLVDEVLSVEGGGNGDAAGDLEGSDDVVSDLVVRGSGESHDGRARVVVFESTEVSICMHRRKSAESYERGRRTT